MEKEALAPVASQVPALDPKYKASQTIGKLAEALSKAQGEFPLIPKDSKVDVYSKPPDRKLLYTYFYADLTTIIDKTRPALSKNGLCFTQGIVTGGFCTLIMHSVSGEYLQTGFIPCKIPDGADMKQVAGTITYVKRISLTAALGVSADEDVDAASMEAEQGNSTTKTPQQQKAQAFANKNTPAKPAAKAQALTQPQLKRLYAIGNTAGWPADAIRAYVMAKVNRTPGEMSKVQYDAACTFLEGSPYDDAQAVELQDMFDKLSADQLKRLEGIKE